MKFFRVQTSILDDPAFAALADEACVFRIMALAARTGNKIPNDASYLQRVLLTDRPINLKKMLIAGFLENVEDASESTNPQQLSTNGVVEPSVEIRSDAHESSPEENRREENRKNKSSISEIYEHWRTVCGKADARYDTISDARRQKITARLKEFSVAELKQALDGVAADPWEDRRRHNDLTKVFRSRENVDRFLELGADPSLLSTEERLRRHFANLEERA